MENNIFDTNFLSEGLRIIFEDLESGEVLDNLQKQSDKLFSTLSSSEKDDIFNIKLILDTPQDEEKLKMNIVDKSNDDVKDIKINMDSNVLWGSKNKTSIIDKTNDIDNVEMSNDSDFKKIKLKLNDTNVSNFKLKLEKNNNDTDTISVKMKFKPEANKDLKLKIDKTSEIGGLALDLNKNDDLKKMLKNNTPNEMIINCLNILKDCKNSMDRLVTIIPNDDVIIKTRNTISELLDKITEDFENLVKNKDKCKEFVINIAKFVIELKMYLKMKFTDLKDDADDSQNRDTNLDKKMDDVEINNEPNTAKNNKMSSAKVPHQTISGNANSNII